MDAKKKVGILGGTFDPIHNAHLQLGFCALKRFHLDQVIFMPTGNSYFKSGKQLVTDAFHRAAMVKLAIRNESRFSFSDMEIRREGETYTADTLKELHELHPEIEYHFILGADSLRDIERWYQPQVIFDNAVILVANRNHQVAEARLQAEIVHLTARFGARIELLQLESMDISSTQIREQIEGGAEESSLVPREVLNYIRTYGLYRENRDYQEDEA